MFCLVSFVPNRRGFPRGSASANYHSRILEIRARDIDVRCLDL